jgi:hypothetical protein
VKHARASVVLAPQFNRLSAVARLVFDDLASRNRACSVVRHIVRRPALATCVSLAVLSVGVTAARAQAPGQTPPLGTSTSEYHAVPPLPEVYPSPRPTVPPPLEMRHGEAALSGSWSYRVGGRGWAATIGDDGRIRFDDESWGAHTGADPLLGLLAGLTFDATDSAMRAARQDPYLSAKLHVMEETFEERLAMRARHDDQVMDRALADLPDYLRAVWRFRAWSAAERRRILFALWDEAAEGGNDRVRSGGAAARAIIETFIAAHLPPGSRDAFRPDELAALNRIRSSRRAFAPYAARPRPARVAPRTAAPVLVAAALRAL